MSSNILSSLFNTLLTALQLAVQVSMYVMVISIALAPLKALGRVRAKKVGGASTGGGE